MFNWFSKNKPDANSIIIPDFGMAIDTNTAKLKKWINSDATIILSINYIELEPDLPTIKNISPITDLHRHGISKMGGGIIESELIDLKGHPSSKMLFKAPKEPTGVVYVLSVIIPFETCSFVIKIQSIEKGMTGIRDSIVADELLNDGVISIGKFGFENWAKDPYDENFSIGSLMNRSEERIYDDRFPNHPLSQIRKMLTRIQSDIRFKPEIDKLNKFDK